MDTFQVIMTVAKDDTETTIKQLYTASNDKEAISQGYKWIMNRKNEVFEKEKITYVKICYYNISPVDLSGYINTGIGITVFVWHINYDRNLKSKIKIAIQEAIVHDN